MTTIAYRDGVLAGDGWAFIRETRVATDDQKIVRLKDGSVLADVGSAVTGKAFEVWLDAGAKPEDGPRNPDDTIVHLRLDGTLRVYEGDFYYDHDPTRFRAWGHGMEFAMGAMAQGATAEEAIGIAARFDAYTGGTILALRLEVSEGFVSAEQFVRELGDRRRD